MANLRANNLTGTGGRNAIKGSVYFGGYVEGISSDYLSVLDHDDLDMGTGDFTFECWVFSVGHKGTDGAATNFMGVLASRNYAAGGFLIQVANDGQLRLIAPLSGGGYFEQSAGPSVFDEWNHIAVTRASGTIKGWVNGIEVISASHSGVGVDFALGGLADIGENGFNTYPADYPFRGYISNLRIVKGTALYTSTFTPSTEELTVVDGTALLCCQDSENPTQEATGKEIIGIGGCYYGKRYSNIATNGDFETGDTTGWTNGGCGTFEVTTGNSHSGTYSLHCVSDGNGDNVYNQLSLNTLLRYKISAYIKCVGPLGTSAKAKMKIGTSNGGSQNYESQTVGYDSYKGFDEWDYVEWIGIPTSSTTYVSFNESSANNVNDWYVDDFRVEVWYPEETENLLANPNFLTGATGWSFSSTPSGEYTISSNRLNVADTSRTNDAFATQQLFATAMAEGKYRITADYAFATGGFDAGIGGNRIWTIQGTSSNTWELEAGNGNVNFRLITGQTGAGYFNSVHLYRIAEPKRNNPVPSVGVDEGVTFSGDTKINSLNYMYFPTGDTSQRGRGRVVYQLGFTQPSGGENTEMQYFDINSGGITTKFGDTVISMYNQAGGGDSTRGIWAGGYDGSSSPDTDVNTIEYITFSNTAKAIDFGDRTVAGRHPQAVSSSTRVVMGGGGNPRINTIDYITTQSTGNATNFGDLTVIRGGLCNSMMSLTRGVFAGGYGAPGANLNTIDYVTMASTGDATDFGDLLVLGANTGGGTVSSNTRGVTAMGTVTPTVSNVIEYITIATTGNALDFGDLTAARKGLAAASSTLRGVWMGGETPTYVDSIDAVTIASTGDAVDFGDVTVVHAVGNGTSRGAACSDCHGGL